MKKVTGIYKITNPKGCIYIGRSTDIYKRWQKYHQKLGVGQHRLYNSFKKYGIDNHKFEIIHQCNKDELNELEIYYIELYKTYNNRHGLNLTKGGSGSSGIVFTEEAIEKIRKASIGNKKGCRTGDKANIPHPSCRNVDCFLNNELIKSYNSIKDAAKDMNTNISTIWKALNGYSKTSCGYYWVYKFSKKSGE